MINTYFLIISFCLVHFFCCAIPLLATIFGLTATLGFFNNEILDNIFVENFEKFEVEILLMSGLLILSAFILKLRAKRLDCCEGEQKKFCTKNEKLNNLFLKIATILYCFSIVTFVFS